MPGPVSDSYDPEFSTAANAAEVEEAVKSVRDTITSIIGSEKLMNILDVCRMIENNPLHTAVFRERELRIIRFAMNRALESL